MKQGVVHFEVSARRDWRWWILLAFGIAFAFAGFTVDPLSNCSEDGECAPILVPIAAGMGLLALIGALAKLKANPSRGSTLDLASGELAWWQGRTANFTGDCGHINAAQISRIAIHRETDSADSFHAYDMSKKRIAFLGEEVLPWPPEKWAAQLIAAFPHIALEVED